MRHLLLLVALALVVFTICNGNVAPQQDTDCPPVVVDMSEAKLVYHASN